MKQRNVRWVLCVLFIFCTTLIQATEVVRVLAIGNSFSEDAIEQNLYEIAKHGDVDMVIGNLYIGGCSLERHAHNAAKNIADYRYRKIVDGKQTQVDRQTLEKALKDESWDYISLQQVSQLSGIYTSFDPYLSELISYVKTLAPQAKLIWHQTWAYAQNSDHGGFVNYDRNQGKMYRAIMKASKKVVKDKQLYKIIPAGTAIQNARKSFIGDRMNRDGYHLNLQYGRFTAACVWYEALTGKNVEDNGYQPAGMDARLVAVAKRSAHLAVKHPYRVTY